MDDIVTVEYRGIVGTLVVGTSVVVDSCEAGVLRLRVATIATPAAAPLPTGSDDSETKDA